MTFTGLLSRMGVLLAAAASVLLFAGVTSAFSAVRYAEVSPGDGDPMVCDDDDPCSLENAIEHASVNNGDEVVVMPGTYSLGTGTATVDNAIDVHGQAGMPRPKITTASTTNFTGAITVVANGATIHDLELETTSGSGGTGFFSAFNSVTAERLVVNSTQGVPACTIHIGTLRDSVCRNSGFGSAIGVSIGSTPGSVTLNLRNVTAATTSLATAIFAHSSGAGFNYVVDAKNTIAFSGNGGNDIAATQANGGTTTVNLEYSNYDLVDPGSTGTVTPAGTGTGNQTQAPAFVNAAGGNYRQAATSPTLEAGSAVSLLGTNDFEGDARSVDGNCDGTSTPDIGADELTPCPAPNNNFANAQVLSGSNASATGTNVTATEDPGEDAYCTEDICGSNPTVTRSVWYRWTSPGSGPATIDLCTANNFDTMLAVFTGSTLGSLSLVGASNNSVDCPPGSFASKVSFPAVQGTTYQILVDGCCGLPQGTFTVTVNGPAAPPPPPGPGPGTGTSGGGGSTPAATPTTKCKKGKKKRKRCGRRKKR